MPNLKKIVKHMAHPLLSKVAAIVDPMSWAYLQSAMDNPQSQMYMAAFRAGCFTRESRREFYLKDCALARDMFKRAEEICALFEAPR